MPAVSSVTLSGIPYVDYVDSGTKWAVNSFTYSFPTSASFYVGFNGGPYGSGEENSGFKAFTAIQQAATASILNMYSAVANVTFTQITETSTQSATLRYAESSLPSTAWGYYPSTSPEGGDAWFGSTNGWYDNPVVGNYAWLTIIHETGHLLGLKHPQDISGSFGATPANVDSLEYTVMSYRSYTGASTTQGLTNATWSFPTTLMMYDIAALQYMYGANYSTNNTNTVYKWNPATGQETINGVAQAAPGGNTIFMTLWDGGGNDTYDFSNYTTNLSVNLNPGSWTTVSTAELANLGNGHTAIGNIANAYLYNNNPASLIENAVGGSGNDTIVGNSADNKITGGAGNDHIDGGSGTDTAVYSGLSTNYQITQNTDGSYTVTDLRAGSPDGTDTLTNVELVQFQNVTTTLGGTPPPVVAPPTILSFSADSAVTGDGITNDNILTLTGTAQANSTVKVYDGTTFLGAIVANGTGAWSFTTAVLADGGHNLAATATDAGGHISALSTVLPVTIDTVAPGVPTIAGFSPDSNVVGDGVTNANALTLHGIAEANSVVHVYDAGALLGTALADATGAWSYATFNSSGSGQGTFLCMCPACMAARAEEAAHGGGITTPLADGEHTFTVAAMDAAGNFSAPSSILDVTIDTAAPVAPTIDTFSTDSGVVGDNITNDNTLTLNGTAEANSTVKIYDGATLLNSVTASGTGTWSYTTGTLANGGHTLTATATDAAGNTGVVSNALVVAIDTTAPVAPTITSFSTDSGVAGDNITNDNTLTLNGTAEPNSTVKIYDGATLLNSVTASGTGAWSYTTGTLTDGFHNLTATATDAAGNTGVASSALTVTVDTSAPVAPTITSFSTDSGVVGDNITNDNTLTLNGTAEANSTVKIYDGATLLNSVTANSSGAWTYTTAALANGGHTLTATATDAAGNTGVVSNALVVAIDTTAPVAPTITSFSTDSGVAGDNITNDNTLTLNGTAEANSTVKIYDGATLLNSVTASGTGTWTYTTLALANGGHSLTATATDIAGNTSVTSSALSVTVDTTAPVAPTITSFSTDSGVVGDNITNDNTLTLNGTAEANSTVKIYDGVTLLNSVTASGTGTWTYTTAALTDGPHSLTATATDAAGNLGVASSALTVTVDTSAPIAPVITSNTTVNTNTIMLGGTAEANATIKVYDGTSLLGSTTANGSGVWTYTTAALSNGPHSLAATANDAAGNASATSQAITSTIGAITVVESFGATSLTQIGNNFFLYNSGGSGPELKYSGAPVVVGQFGTWTPFGAEQTVNGYEVAFKIPGSDSYTVWNVDANGNYVSNVFGAVTGSNATLISLETSFQQDLNGDGKIGTTTTTTPTVPSQPTPTVIESFGSTSLAQVGNNFYLYNSAGSGPELKYNGAPVVAGQFGTWTPIGAEQTANGYEVAFKIPGSDSYTVWNVDANGNYISNVFGAVSGSNATLISLETSFQQDLNGDGKIGAGTPAPAAPSISSFTTDSGIVGDRITNDNTLALTGTAQANSTVKIYDSATLLNSVTANSSGGWTYTTAALVNGAHSLTATATDASGNTSLASSALTVTIDTTAPAVTQTIANPASGIELPGNTITVTLSFSEAVTVTGTPTLALNDGGTATYTGGSSTNALTFSYTVGASDATVAALAVTGVNLLNGATISDVAGNSANLAAALKTFTGLQIDPPTVPSAPTIGTFSTDSGAVGDHITNDNTLTLSGAAAASSTVKVYDGASLLGSVAAGANGAWTYTTAALGEGSHNLTATDTTAGGTSAASTALTVTIDTVAPNAPAITGDATVNTNEVAFGGAAEADSTVKVFDGATLLGTAVTDGTGAWAYTSSPLSSGSHSFTATATDVAGNTSVTSQSVSQTIGGSTVIESFGSTSLTEVGNNFYLCSSGGSGPELKYSGAAVVVGRFGAWTPFGAEQTANGYEVAFKIQGSDSYTVWNVDANGNYISNVFGAVSGSNATLIALETSFHQDLNGDGVIGVATPTVTPTVIESFGSTSLTAVGDNFYLYNSSGSGPELKYSGAAVVAGQFGGWTPIGAEQTANGYEVAFKIQGSDSYTVWNVDANGNYISNVFGAVSGSNATLISLETSFHQDINGDGVIGPAAAPLLVNDQAPAPATVVTGASGNDTLISTSANEVFFGNGGNNTFVFSGAIGTDSIADFKPVNDTVELSHNVFANFADVLAHATQIGPDVTIHVDATNSITLQNTVLSHLINNNFHLV